MIHCLRSLLTLLFSLTDKVDDAIVDQRFEDLYHYLWVMLEHPHIPQVGSKYFYESARGHQVQLLIKYCNHVCR